MLYTVFSMKVPDSNLTVSNRTNVIVHRVALIFTCIAAMFGMMTTLGVAEQSKNYLGVGTVMGLMLAWVFYSTWQFSRSTMSNRQSRKTSFIRLAIFHAFSTIYLIGIVDFMSPFLYMWSLLIIANYLYFGLAGSLISILNLYAIMLINIIGLSLSSADTLEMIIGTFITASVGLVTVYVVRSTQTDQQEMDRSQAQISLQQDRTLTLINNLADAVLSTDRFGTITLYNAAVLNLLDTNDNIVGKSIDKVLNIKSTEGEKLSGWELLHRSTTVTVRDDIIAKLGNDKIRLEMTFSPIRGNYTSSDDDYELGGYVVILRDITKSKSLEEERDEFISVVSHELRTPITIAEGTLSNVAVMMDKAGDAKHSRLKGAVDMAHDQVVFLARMVNDLSTLSRAERGIADEAEFIDVDEMIHDLYNEYHPEAEAKKLAFDLSVSGKAGHVMASRLYLKELLQNFVTNAIKYTHGGSVTIKVKKTKDILSIAVKDTGIGISKPDQKRIFDKFYRAEDYRTRETNGTGLGLYVAEKLARKLNTTIDIVSRLNHGSTFSIELPAVDKKAIAKSDQSSTDQPT